MGPAGPRAIGGTSNAAPNAAGAAAVCSPPTGAPGATPSATEILGALEASALDLGVPGPDQVFGIGRVRVNVDPPRVARPDAGSARLGPRPGGGQVHRPLALARVHLDARRGRQPGDARAQTFPRGITIDTRRLPDGWHALRATARDYPGNVGTLDWSVKVDNTRPVLIVRAVKAQRLHPRPPRAEGPDRRLRTVRLIVALADPVDRPPAGHDHGRPARRDTTPARIVGITPGQSRTVLAGRLVKGSTRCGSPWPTVRATPSR